LEIFGQLKKYRHRLVWRSDTEVVELALARGLAVAPRQTAILAVPDLARELLRGMELGVGEALDDRAESLLFGRRTVSADAVREIVPVGVRYLRTLFLNQTPDVLPLCHSFLPCLSPISLGVSLAPARQDSGARGLRFSENRVIMNRIKHNLSIVKYE